MMTLDSELQTFDEPFGLCSPSLPTSHTRVNHNSSTVEELLLNKDECSEMRKDIFSQGSFTFSQADEHRTTPSCCDLNKESGSLNCEKRDQITYGESLNLPEDFSNLCLSANGNRLSSTPRNDAHPNYLFETVESQDFSGIVKSSLAYPCDVSLHESSDAASDTIDLNVCETSFRGDKGSNIGVLEGTAKLAAWDVARRSRESINESKTDSVITGKSYKNPSNSGNQEANTSFKMERNSSKVDAPARSTVIVRVGATRGSRRAVGLTPQFAHPHRSPPRPLRTSAPPSSALSATADGGSGVEDELGTKSVRPTRVQSSLELRNLTFQAWCAKRGKQYLEERRSEQLKRMQAEEETKRQRAEKAKQNEEIFAMWIAKKRAQEMDERKKQQKKEEEKQKEEESKMQHEVEAAKAYEAWKNQKTKQVKCRRSVIEVAREKTLEEMKRKFDKAVAAHLAFEAWQKQANEKLQKAHRLAVARAKKEKLRKSEEEAMRKELARTSYAKWESRKASEPQITRTTSLHSVTHKPPWRPTSGRVVLP